jgi:hypothetical protein
MKAKSKILLSVSILLLTMLACGLPSGSNTASPSAPQGPTILYQDDFSSTSSGWDVYSDADMTTDYLNGGYHIMVTTTQYYSWANPGKVFSDTRTETNGKFLAGPQDAELGLICRYKDNNNFYFGIVSSDGYYGVFKNLNGEFNLIGTDTMSTSSKINQGLSATNFVRFDCVGDTLTLYANGEVLAQVKDSEFTNGDVGLIAGTYDVAGTDAWFDDIVVYQP